LAAGPGRRGGRALIRHAFVDIGLRRVYAETMAVNVASRAVMESLGLTYLRTVHRQWDDPLPGTEQGEVGYALTLEHLQERRF
jgi:RimJ/RimL family protein N-acetyltransferase